MNTHNKVIFYSDHACSYVRIVYLPSKSLSLVGAGVSVVDGSSLAAGITPSCTSVTGSVVAVSSCDFCGCRFYRQRLLLFLSFTSLGLC